jgi:hypothetical protein
MLSFPLKKEWYDKIKSGEKTVEYREVKPYWTRRIMNFKFYWAQFIKPKDRGEWFRNFPTEFFSDCYPAIKAECLLRHGYTGRYVTANITKIEVVDGKETDLHIDKPVYAIHLADVREAE